jgi:hypothetical protein
MSKKLQIKIFFKKNGRVKNCWKFLKKEFTSKWDGNLPNGNLPATSHAYIIHPSISHFVSSLFIHSNVC